MSTQWVIVNSTRETCGIIFWPLNVDEFKNAVDTKKIKGEIRKGEWLGLDNKVGNNGRTIFLLDDPQKIQKILEEDLGKYYMWEAPVFFKKLDK